MIKQYYEWFSGSARPSAGLPQPFVPCSGHRFIMTLTKLISMRKGKGQQSKVKVSEVKRNCAPIWQLSDRNSSLNLHMSTKWCTKKLNWNFFIMDYSTSRLFCEVIPMDYIGLCLYNDICGLCVMTITGNVLLLDVCWLFIYFFFFFFFGGGRGVIYCSNYYSLYNTHAHIYIYIYMCVCIYSLVSTKLDWNYGCFIRIWSI